MKYISAKRYGHEQGLTCCFRQWRAESHCNLIHGYPLSFTFEFEADQLDEKNWVVDFGGLKSLKSVLERHFDHTLIVAQDDPRIDDLTMLGQLELARVLVFPDVGCEKIAEYAFGLADNWLEKNNYKPRVRVRSVTVAEHENNYARVESNGE